MKRSRAWFAIANGYLLGCVLAVAATTAAPAQDYPSKPVTIICDAAPGSTPDVDTRFIAEGLGKIWGQQVVTVDHPGGGGSIGARAAADAVPDGYTLYMPVLATFIAQPGVAPNLPLQLPRDFLPIGFTAENPMFIAVNPKLGVNTLPELIALAKQKPGAISYATTGVGRLTHLTGELLQMRTGINLLLVPYAGGPARAASDVANGRVSFIIEGYSGIAGAIKSGLLKPIAVASAERLPDFPDLPTVAETVPGFAATGWQIMVAPVGTPDAIVQKVSADLRKVVDDPELKQKLGRLGSYTRHMTPTEALAFVQGEQKTWRPVLEKIAGKAKSN
ncbi:MAG TPA: tripartite tricarboxylate transporter substrate binding protein [Xanthobacteraceae bacterium]|nr:tripartite tricarboxylate transporter substrate binding protein [Xanthobacteraceae bacterium]